MWTLYTYENGDREAEKADAKVDQDCSTGVVPVSILQGNGSSSLTSRGRNP